MQSPTPVQSFGLGRSLLGAATLASGLLQLVVGDFVRLVPQLPAWVPAHSALAYLMGVVLVVLGLAILSGRGAREAASVLGALILVMVLFLWVPALWASPGIDRPWLRGFMWTNPLKALALVGGASILVARSPDELSRIALLTRPIGRLEPAGAFLLAAFLVVCGVQHFVYSDFVTTLVPSWIPGQRFWTYFAGVALIAGGVGSLVRPLARLAASLSALMIFSWVFLVHIPRALAGPNHANETAGVFEALALSGVALLVAATRPSQAAAS
jgi:uncharacterized membrane protein